MYRLAAIGRTLAIAGAVFGVWVRTAAACAICLSAVNPSPGQRLDDADKAVLAAATEAGGGWRVLAVLKGDGPLDIDRLNSGSPPRNETPAGRGELLIRSSLGHVWSSMGQFDMSYAAWLRDFVRSPKPDVRTVWGRTVPNMQAWRKRLALVLPQLDCGDPGIESLAYGELRRAPYAAIRDSGSTLRSSELRRRIATQDDALRRAVNMLLLGVVGDASAAKWIEDRLKTARTVGAATDLAALLAAYLELRGSVRLNWVVDTYLLDDARVVPEIEAALRALTVHGDTDAVIPRSDVAQAYLKFIRRRPGMAGFVAMDLLRWKEWAATGDYLVLLKNGAIKDPAGEFAARNYVRSSPQASGRVELELRNE